MTQGSRSPLGDGNPLEAAGGGGALGVWEHTAPVDHLAFSEGFRPASTEVRTSVVLASALCSPVQSSLERQLYL